MVALAATVLSLPTAAQRLPPNKQPGPSAPDFGPALGAIKNGDATELRKVLEEARLAGPSAAALAPAIADRLSRGLTLGLTEAALDTLGDLGAVRESAIVAKYAIHRNAKIRRAAVRALARSKGPVAATALLRALSDPDPNVRGTAASGLGALQARDALPALAVALDHRVMEAASSIGQLCSGDDCEKLVERLGKLPFEVMTTGLDAILFRGTPDVSDDLKVKIIGRVRALSTAESATFLRGVQNRWPKNGSARVREALEQSLAHAVGNAS